MMLTWRVFSDDNVQGELVTAERMFINSGNGLIFSVKPPASDVDPEPEAPKPAKSSSFAKKKKKPLIMITLRAYNAGAWTKLEMVS